MGKRYQECNLVIRLFRRLRYQPFYFFYALFFATASYLKSRNIESFKLVFKVLYSEWQMKANWYYTIDEVRKHLDSIIQRNK